VIAFSALLATRHPVDATDAPSPLLGKLAPALKGHELGGGTFSLKSERGKIVVVTSGRRGAGPVSKRPRSSRRTRGAFATRRRRGRCRLRRHGLVGDEFRGALRPRSIPRSSTPVARRQQLRVVSPPTTFVINRQGRVAVTLLGATTAKQLRPSWRESHREDREVVLVVGPRVTLRPRVALLEAPSTASAQGRIAHLETLVKCPACDDLSVAQSNATSSIAVRQTSLVG